MAEALSHLRVVELADGVQAASCGKQFAAWGAHVTVVEPEGGHPLRSASPLATGPGGESVSLLWEYLGARKSKGHRAEGEGRQGWLGELIAGADVLITDWKAARLEDEGLGPDALASLNTGLVAVRMSPFGSTGPYAGFEGTDLIVQALSGFCSFNGLPGREPLKAPANIGAFVCGVSAFVGALAALHERRSSGRGQTVECAYVEAIASIVPYLRTEYFGTPFGRTGTTGTGNDTYRTADGWVYFSVAAERAWESFLIGMDIDPETVPEGLRTPEGRSAGNAGLRAFVAGAVSSRSAIDVFLALNTLRIVTGVLFTPEDLLDNPHLQERGFLHTFDHPQLGRLVFPGAPGRLYTTPMAPPDSPTQDSKSNSSSKFQPPTSNQGPSDTPAQIPTSKFQFPAPAPPPPLHGLRILDLTAAWIGTYATLLLADLGAGVIKVESPARPDVWRGGEALRRPVPPSARPEAHPWNVNVNFNSVNRNKRDLTLDLDTEKGKELFLRLAGRADLVMENYTPRVMGNFGLGYEDLRRVNEDVIMVSFSGFGATGPYSDFRAIGASTEMQAGWDCLLGYPGHDEPLMLGAMFADAISGLHMAAMALVALEHRAGDRRRPAGRRRHVRGLRQLHRRGAAEGVGGRRRQRAARQPPSRHGPARRLPLRWRRPLARDRVSGRHNLAGAAVRRRPRPRPAGVVDGSRTSRGRRCPRRGGWRLDVGPRPARADAAAASRGRTCRGGAEHGTGAGRPALRGPRVVHTDDASRPGHASLQWLPLAILAHPARRDDAAAAPRRARPRGPAHRVGPHAARESRPCSPKASPAKFSRRLRIRIKLGGDECPTDCALSPPA